MVVVVAVVVRGIAGNFSGGVQNVLWIFCDNSSTKPQQGSRRYHTSPALCTPITPFPANRPHRLRSEFSGFLFALFLHTEWSLLLHDIIGDWMIPSLLQRTRQQRLQRRLSVLLNGPDNPQNCPFPLGFRHPARGGPSHVHRHIGNMNRKVGKGCTCGSGDKICLRSDTQTDVLITILCYCSRRRSNNQWVCPLPEKFLSWFVKIS